MEHNMDENDIETLQQNLQNLKNMSHSAVGDYEDLQRKYDQNQKHYEDLKERLKTTEEQLTVLRDLLEPACLEHYALEEKYKVEVDCRNMALDCARKVVKENDKLKRESQALQKYLNRDSDNMNIMETLAEITREDENDDEANRLKNADMEKALDKLKEEVASYRMALQKAEKDKRDAEESERQIKELYDEECETTKKLQTSIMKYEKQLNQLQRVSVLALDDYNEVCKGYQIEKGLRNELANRNLELKNERDHLSKQSQAVLLEISSEEKLVQAYMKQEELEKQKTDLQVSLESEIKDLKEQLSKSDHHNEVSNLSSKLDVATEQMGTLQEQLTEAREESDKLKEILKESEQKDTAVEDDLFSASSRPVPLAPPSPVPPPPPCPVGMFQPLNNALKITRKAKTADSGTPPASPKVDPLTQMMDELKLRNTNRLRGDCQKRSRLPTEWGETKIPDSKNMDQLSNVLESLKRQNRHQVNMSPPQDTATSELSQVYGKVCKNQSKNLNSISEEHSLSPKSSTEQEPEPHETARSRRSAKSLIRKFEPKK